MNYVIERTEEGFVKGFNEPPIQLPFYEACDYLQSQGKSMKLISLAMGGTPQYVSIAKHKKIKKVTDPHKAIGLLKMYNILVFPYTSIEELELVLQEKIRQQNEALRASKVY